jgi:hypothetical protein
MSPGTFLVVKSVRKTIRTTKYTQTRPTSVPKYVWYLLTTDRFRPRSLVPPFACALHPSGSDDGMLFKGKTGAAWRDLPERYGPWKTAYTRLRGWAIPTQTTNEPAADRSSAA